MAGLLTNGFETRDPEWSAGFFCGLILNFDLI